MASCHLNGQTYWVNRGSDMLRSCIRIRVFWVFGPCICSYMICVDWTRLSGKYFGVFLVACASDDENHIFHIAFAVVE